jgi:hypothetical protein
MKTRQKERNHLAGTGTPVIAKKEGRPEAAFD